MKKKHVWSGRMYCRRACEDCHGRCIHVDRLRYVDETRHGINHDLVWYHHGDDPRGGYDAQDRHKCTLKTFSSWAVSEVREIVEGLYVMEQNTGGRDGTEVDP